MTALVEVITHKFRNLLSRGAKRSIRISEIIIFCVVVAICDPVHDVEAIFHLSYVITESGNLFMKYE